MAARSVISSTVRGSLSNSRSIFNVSKTEGTQCSLGRTNCRCTDSTRNSGCVVSRSWAPRKALHRSSLVRASTAEQLTADGSADTAAERTRLKAKLLEQMALTSGNLTEECIATIHELEKFNPNPEPLYNPELYVGYWEQLKAGHKGTGRKGEGKAAVGFEGVSVTLGRATFNMFKPGDLDIVMGEVINGVEEVVRDKESVYSLYIQFTTKTPKGDDLPPIDGLIINAAKQTIDSGVRLKLAFYQTTIRPSYPERDLEAWKEIFQEASGGTMNEETGAITVENPKHNPAHLDITYIDEELRISKGHMGTYVVVGRTQPPEFVN